MGCCKSKREPSYVYTTTCRSPAGFECSKTYTTYWSDGTVMNESKYFAPYRVNDHNDQGRRMYPEYVAAMVIKHPKNPPNITEFESDCLDEHNLARARHGVGPLALDKKLCKFATEWAQELANRNRLHNREDPRYGENLYMACGKNVTGRDPVKAWYTELWSYSYHNPTFSSNTGHFTQLVWKNSEKLGVGMATSGGNTFVVCNYYPPGNFAGEFPSNVPPPL